MMDSQINRRKYSVEEQFLVDSKTPIYRYLSFLQLVDMLERKKLYLQKISYWDDPSEGSRYMSLLQDMPLIKATVVNGNVNITSENTRKDEVVMKMTYPFGTSWSLLLESDAMWRIYSQDKMGLQIQTSVEKLESILGRVEFPNKYIEIEKYFDMQYAVGKVNHPHNHNQADNIRSLEHFLIKREAFKHEEEVRGLVKFSISDIRYALACSEENVDIISNILVSSFFIEEKIVYTPIADDFIEAVRIDPRADDWISQTITSYCKSKGIADVKRSDLYGNK